MPGIGRGPSGPTPHRWLPMRAACHVALLLTTDWLWGLSVIKLRPLLPIGEEGLDHMKGSPQSQSMVRDSTHLTSSSSGKQPFSPLPWPAGCHSALKTVGFPWEASILSFRTPPYPMDFTGIAWILWAMPEICETQETVNLVGPYESRKLNRGKAGCFLISPPKGLLSMFAYMN